MHLSVVGLSPKISSSHLCIRMVHTFSNPQAKFFVTSSKPTGVFKVLFKRPFVKVICLFCSTSLTPQRCNVVARNIYQFHIAFLLITLNPTVPHRLLASLSRPDAINLQLSINLSCIFLHTPVPSLYLTPANLTLILTLKLMYFSLFSAMTPISFLLNLLPSSLMNK